MNDRSGARISRIRGRAADGQPGHRAMSIRIAVLVAYLIFLFWAGSRPDPFPAPPAGILGWDKLLHAVAFGVLQVLAVGVLQAVPRVGRLAGHGVAIAFASVLGGALEAYQATLGYRSAELLDWVADTVGAVFAAVVLVVLARRRIE